jgi:hypothetical protein
MIKSVAREDFVKLHSNPWVYLGECQPALFVELLEDYFECFV